MQTPSSFLQERKLKKIFTLLAIPMIGNPYGNPTSVIIT